MCVKQSALFSHSSTPTRDEEILCPVIFLDCSCRIGLKPGKVFIANYAQTCCYRVTDCQTQENAKMMDGMWINKVAISSIDRLLDDPVSEPNQQLMPTCSAPLFISLCWFQDLYKGSPGIQEELMLTKCALSSTCSTPAPRSWLRVSFILSGRLYTSHAATSVSSGKSFFLWRQTCFILFPLSPNCQAAVVNTAFF